ncbi:MAG: insulinase family protein [Bacteroidetes bacterium]|nr:insulinase family protein [Bacteroidota bacterium]
MKIDVTKYRLENGLRVLVHTDTSTPMAVVNLLYNVGSKDENPSMTGFAHLFEHLMFGGTRAVPNFDSALQLAGGESNAFTNCDFTNFYITIPVANIETALWLESDRMKGPDLSEKSLRVQKMVVAEEYRQRYLNQPYGDAMLHLRPLVYKVHPYRWATIGSDILHIEKASPKTVYEFFKTHYRPANAILTIAGNINPEKAFKLARKWFNDIAPGKSVNSRNLPAEPVRQAGATLDLFRNVPANALYRAWIVNPRASNGFHTFDMITDILAGGESGRLYASLVREKRLFTEINAFVTGEIEPGMVIVNGRLAPGVSKETAVEEIDREMARLAAGQITARELQKVRNRYASSFHMANTGVLQKAIALSHHELIDDASSINRMVGLYNNITIEMISDAVKERLNPAMASTLWYNKTDQNDATE